MTNDVILKAEGICKQFGGIQVLKSVDLEIKKGEVHALMGENGAGKSTIIKIITGVYKKDSGQIYVDGLPVQINSRTDARKNGISVIYQELSLVPSLTVTENIFLGQEIKKNNMPDKKAMKKRVIELINEYGFILDPDAMVESLGMAKRQMIEILKALSCESKLIIMDEPTSSLSAGEAETLFKTIENLTKLGNSILYISHRLDEINRLADRVTVMRDGKNIGVLEKADITPEKVTAMMIGKEIEKPEKRKVSVSETNLLEVKNLYYKKQLHNISFTAYGGEILGIGGLVGSGRTELIKCLYGALRKSGGTAELNGKPISGSINRNIRRGFGFVPEDRRNEGLFPILSVERNINVASYDILAAANFWVKRRKEQKNAEEAIKKFDIRPAMRELPVGNFSGGNQQKVVLSRWLTRDLNVLFFDEPTAGVDVGVKAEIYNYVKELADHGAIVIMVSSDLEELTELSDRILVIHDGRFFEEFRDGCATQSDILLAASGIHTGRGIPLDEE